MSDPDKQALTAIGFFFAAIAFIVLCFYGLISYEAEIINDPWFE